MSMSVTTGAQYMKFYYPDSSLEIYAHRNCLNGQFSDIAGRLNGAQTYLFTVSDVKIVQVRALKSQIQSQQSIKNNLEPVKR